jgi:ABC-type uncharacterized transport system permease subunit
MFAGLTDRQWLECAAGFYLAGFLLGTWLITRRERPSGPSVYALILVGYAVQYFGLYLRGRADGGCPLGNTFELLQFVAWSAITLYLVVGVIFRSSVFGYITAGLGAALTLASLAVPAWDATRAAHLFGDNPWIELHAALALFSYGVFGLLAVTSSLFLLRNYSLKSKQLDGWFSFLPSILDLDHIGLRLLGAGVALLAVSLAVGTVYWLHDNSTVNASKLLTGGVWAAYAAVLILRLAGRLAAKRFAWTCIVLFGIALISLGQVNASQPPAVAAGKEERRP